MLGIENLPVSGTEAWRTDQDSMTMKRIGIEQGFPNPGKRRALGARAQAEERFEAAGLAASRLQVRRDVTTAWFDLYYAHEEHAALVALVRETELEAETATAAVAGGRLGPAEALAARAAIEQAMRPAGDARTRDRARADRACAARRRGCGAPARHRAEYGRAAAAAASSSSRGSARIRRCR